MFIHIRDQNSLLMGKTVLILVAMILFSSCATTPQIHSKVTVFHKLPQDVQAKKYAFFTLKEQRNSLKHEVYQKMVRSELSQIGYEETDPKNADVLVGFNYMIGPGAEKIGSMPIIGQTGVRSSNTSGSLTTFGNTGLYSSQTTYTPSYGVVGATSYSYTEYPRALVFIIFDNEPNKKKNKGILYQGQVFNSGSSSELAEVMPVMIRALFKQFPGESGTTYNIRLPVKNYYEEGTQKKRRSVKKASH